MGIDTLLDHRCKIYHVVREYKSQGYGLPDGVVFDYPDEPDSGGETPCHFGWDKESAVDGEPYSKLAGINKLTLLPDADIRLNDKIVNCETGESYTAGYPRNIRGHHIAISLRAVGWQGVT